MKQTPEMQAVQRAMRPGQITRDGFLGADSRDLADLLAADDAAVKALDLTHRRIAARMTALRDAGLRGLGDFISVPPHFEVRVDSVRGRLPCPFGHPGLLAKTNITVRNLALKAEVTFTDLNIHLIADHGFYEGRGSAFRFEPAGLADILEIRPEA
jgi:hypothetical protein